MIIVIEVIEIIFIQRFTMLFKHLYGLYSYFYKNEVIGKSILQCDSLVHWKVPEASSRLSTISVHSISGQNRGKLVRASSENRQWLRVVLDFTCGQDVSSPRGI